MLPEEQLQVIDALTPSLTDKDENVRREALHCMVGFGLDGLGRIIDVLEDANSDNACKSDAVGAIGLAFSEGKVDKSGIVKDAIKALEKCLPKPELCAAAVDAFGEIGPQAVSAKSKLLALLDGKKGQNMLCVKIGAALLKISPINN
ncbi:MAG TPA: hypothetical protein VKX17_04820 [Planctomycetota bacterium]|nr:hypothetical protein [Planctomycetota bacterium]